MQSKKLLAHTLLAVLLAGASVAAQAQKAGTWFGGVGATRIDPNTSSGNLSAPSAPGTQVDIGPDTQPTLFLGYMLTDHWSVEVPVGFGFEHDINGAGAIGGTGRIGTTKVLPVSVFAQYRFLEPESRFRPYVLGGLTYAYFYGVVNANFSLGAAASLFKGVLSLILILAANKIAHLVGEDGLYRK